MNYITWANALSTEEGGSQGNMVEEREHGRREGARFKRGGTVTLREERPVHRSPLRSLPTQTKFFLEEKQTPFGGVAEAELRTDARILARVITPRWRSQQQPRQGLALT